MWRFPRTIFLALSIPLIFTGCGSPKPPQPPSLKLPKPPSDLRAVRKGNKVLLSWTVPTVTTDRQTARSFGATDICRGLNPALTKCGTPAGQAAPLPAAGKSSGKKLNGTYSDALPLALLEKNATGFATYAIEVLNAEGQGAGLSNQVHVALAATLPPPQDFAAHVTSKGVLLTWTSDAPAPTVQLRYVYRVYRRLEGSLQEILAGEAVCDGTKRFSLTDSSLEWEKTYEYHAEAVTVITQPDKTEIRVDGDDTPDVKVLAHDVFPPAVPSGLQAAFSGPGQEAFIDLIWAPDTDADLNGYNVYRHEEGAAPVKVNAELVKTPAYRDAAVRPGKHYFYSVSAVDLRGNESARSEETSESVP
jgi:hypothetical protein